MDQQPEQQPAEEKRTRAHSGAVISAQDAQRLAAEQLTRTGRRLRILTGDRTTGKLHIGHYVGSLRDRVRLQHSYDTYVLLADVQALTTHYDRPEVLRQSVMDVALDYMAVGLAPYEGGTDDGSQVKLVIQSMVPAIAELTVYYGLLIPMSIILDNPTTKAEAQQQGVGFMDEHLEVARLKLEHQPASVMGALKEDIEKLQAYFPEIGEISLELMSLAYESAEKKGDISLQQTMDNLAASTPAGKLVRLEYIEIPEWRRFVRDFIINFKRSSGLRQMNYGFLGYPVSQAADITFVGAHLVPVGEDQVPHIELTRDIVQRFNRQYGETLVEPRALVGGGGVVKGLDGSAKMSKSLDNAIYLSDSYDEIWRRISKAVTDPQRVRRSDPGRPEVCNIFAWHQLFNQQTEPESIDEGALKVYNVEEVAHNCRTAGFGCVDCKRMLAAKLDALLAPMRLCRAAWEARPDDLRDVLLAGTVQSNSWLPTAMAS